MLNSEIGKEIFCLGNVFFFFETMVIPFSCNFRTICIDFYFSCCMFMAKFAINIGERILCVPLLKTDE